MKCFVNEDCIGCGLCVSTCNEVFSKEDEGQASAIETEIPSRLIDSVIKAMDGCPMGAIVEIK